MAKKPEQTKSKWTKVGAVLKGEKGRFVVLGDTKNKKSEYNYNVTVTVTNEGGDVLASTTNGTLSLQDPRKKPFLTEEQIERIPDMVVAELFIVQK